MTSQFRFRASSRLLSALLLTCFCLPAAAQMGKGKGSGGSPADASGGVEGRDAEIRDSGLTPVFPDRYLCEPIASPYASPTRYDGSRRRGDRNQGLHGGIDLSLKDRTALLAVAGGKVIAKGAGGQLEGNYLWLMHAPSDSGLPFWIYSKYQHLAELPELNEGDTVRVGQVVALSGNTGTVGGHYRGAGYHHLHWSLRVGQSDQYTRFGTYGSMVKTPDGQSADPLILYLADIADPADIAALAPERKRVRIPVASDAAGIVPAGSKVVWPVACTSRK